ncbi:PRC-barrel domain-containing protein [Paracoccaceae bacterium GXU_MW_L88]
MARKLTEILDLNLAASDGREAPVVDLYLNEEGWTVDYIVADLGDWLREHRVVINTRRTNAPTDTLWPTDVPESEMENAPTPADHEAIPERELADMDMPSVILGPAGSVFSPAFLEAQFQRAHAGESGDEHESHGNPKLHAFSTLRGMAVWANDGEFGRIADFRADETGRTLTFLKIETGGFFERRSVWVPIAKVSHLYAEGPYLVLDAARSDIDKTPENGEPNEDDKAWEDNIMAYWSLGS